MKAVELRDLTVAAGPVSPEKLAMPAVDQRARVVSARPIGPFYFIRRSMVVQIALDDFESDGGMLWMGLDGHSDVKNQRPIIHEASAPAPG